MMLKFVFGQFARLLPPVPTDWERFSRKLARPEQYLTPGFVNKFQNYRTHPIHSHNLLRYAIASHGLCVAMLHVDKDRVMLHTKDEKGRYSCWKWVPSIDGVVALNARHGVSVGAKSDDPTMNLIVNRCFSSLIETAGGYSMEHVSVQKAWGAYTRTLPVFSAGNTGLKVGMPG